MTTTKRWPLPLGSGPDPAGEAAITVAGLVKTFASVRALDGLDLMVPAGCVYGVLGPNGAGKTTLVRILATLLHPDGGTARVLGHDVVHEAAAVRRRVSLTGQFAALDEDLTGFENLVLLGRLRGYARSWAGERSRDLLDAFALSEAAGRQVKTYSGGMQRRLDLAASLVVTPELLFLDEPTTGLDPRSRAQIWRIVRALAAAGTTVLLTTQYLDEADHLADRIAIIDRGRVIAEGTPGELKAATAAGVLRLRLFDPSQRPAARQVLSQVLAMPVQLDEDPAVLTAQSSQQNRVVAGLAALSQRGITVQAFAFGQASLDEVFLALTGHPAGDAAASTEEASA